MARAYSEDLRIRVIRSIEEDGESARGAGRRFGISESSAVKGVGRFRREGSVAAKKTGRPRGLKVAAHREFLIALMKDRDTTLDELQIALLEERGMSASRVLLWRFVHEQGLSFKKTLLASERNRPDVALARWLWQRSQHTLTPDQLVFVNEIWARTDMTPLRGWSLRGQRLMAKAPGGHWATTTFTAALRHDRIVAPLILDGPMNGEVFVSWVEPFLVPNLKPGDIVIMNNLPAHKVAGVEAAIEAAGAERLFLPPYSPDLNPIEMVFSKLKNLIRKGAWRTQEALWKGIGETIDQISQEECKNYLRHAGYA